MPRLLVYRLACAGAVAAIALACAGQPAALAAAASEGNAFNELAEGGKEEEAVLKKTTSTATTGSSSSGSGPITSTVLVAGLGVAAVLLVGIAYVILRDARSVAPVGDGPVTGRPGRDPAVALRKRRARAKAARRQRKRNR